MQQCCSFEKEQQSGKNVIPFERNNKLQQCYPFEKERQSGENVVPSKRNNTMQKFAEMQKSVQKSIYTNRTEKVMHKI